MQDVLGYADDSQAPPTSTQCCATQTIYSVPLANLQGVEVPFAAYRQEAEEAFQLVACCKYKKSGKSSSC